MRCLLLSIYHPPEVGANSRIVDGLATELARLGEEVTVLTDIPHYPHGVVPRKYRRTLFRRERGEDRTVIRTWLLVTPRGNKWLRLANNLTFALSAIAGGMLAGRQEVIYVYSPPLFLGFTAWVLSRLKRIPFVFNVQDIYPEIAIRHGVVRGRRAIALLEAFERWVYRKAARVSVISEGFKENLAAKGVPPEKIVVVPNAVETELFRPLPRDNAFRREAGLGDAFVVMYAGNIGFSQGLETVVEAARLLADEPEIRFAIVGDGVKRQEIADLAASYALANLVFLPYQPRERMPEVLAAADASLVILKPEKSRTTIQSKTYEIMAMARPIIASVDGDGDNWRLIAEAGAGVWAEPGSPEALAACVRALHADPERRARLGRSGRRYVEAHNSTRAVGAHYRAVLAEASRATTDRHR